MDLTILGSSGSYPTASNPCSGYLVRSNGYNVWMDAGNGTLQQLQRHIAIRDVHAVILSHAHPDHCADIYPFFFAVLHPEPEQPIPIITPPGVRERLSALIGADSTERFASYLRWHELEPGDRTTLGPLDIEAFDAAHSIVNRSYRITADDRVLTYSGDTGPNDHLAEAARDANLFLCEASWSEDDVGLMEPIHLTAAGAGAAARDAGVDRLLLTHMWASNDPDVMTEQAASTFDGSLDLAMRTETVSV